jgi:predicted N-acyltransferase
MYRLEILDSIDQIPREEWDALAKTANWPFLEWGFLYSLEASGCVGSETSWKPQHLLYFQEDELIALSPAYIRSDSMGDFVFDFNWAQVASQLGTEYYPKFVCTSPFTPSVGNQIVVKEGRDSRIIRASLLEAVKEYAQQQGCTSVHMLWTADEMNDVLDEGNFSRWDHQYYILENKKYESFDDYLQIFKKNQRKNIRKERKSMNDQGITFRLFTGSDLNDDLMRWMHIFYRNTNVQFGPWAAYFLNEDFFIQVGRYWPESVVLIAAYKTDEEEPVAMSMLVRNDKMLIGRYWGAREYIKDLHFNTCYYEAIEYLIAEGIELFDPGMGSSHKTRRGFESRTHGSYHFFFQPLMQQVFREYIPQFNEYEEKLVEQLNIQMPIKHSI